MKTFFAMLCLTASIALAQIGTSTMTGRVTDASGAIVPNTTITVVQKATNFTFNATTNEDGIYRVLSLQPGFYRVTFEAAGFKKAIRDEIELRTGDTLAVDMAMQVGQVSDAVEVTGGAQLLETETSSTGTVMSGKVLYDMPLYQRFVNSTMNLVPGMTTGGYAYGGDLGAYHLAGQRAGAIGIFEDGVNGNDQGAGTATIKPIQNAMAEVKVLTTLPPAEYGHSAGGVINAVKKSGTNEIHGMGSFYGRWRRMQHRLFFDRQTTAQIGVPTVFFMPDANVGGPVVIPKIYNGKNKTFFFFAWQKLIEEKYAQVDSTVPTPEMKGGNFNFPGVNSNLIYDPATTRNVGGVWMRDPFPGNIIPTNRIDPVAQKIIAADPWQAPSRPGTFTTTGPSGNYLANEFARTYLPDYNLRLDHQFSSAFKTYFSWTDNQYSGYQRPWNIKPDKTEYDYVGGYYAPSRNQNYSVGKTWIMSPSIVNDARVGYYRRWAETQQPTFKQGWGQKLGIPNIDDTLFPYLGSGNGNDRNNVGTLYGISGPSIIAPNRTVNETLSFRDDLSYIKGTHAFKFGYEWLRFRLNSATLGNPVQFNFETTQGLLPNGQNMPNTGNTFAGFMTGYVNQAIFRSEVSSWLPRSSINSFYLQDDWKITPRLTANIGLRYSTESPFNTKYGVQSQFDPTVRDPITGNLGAITHPTNGLNRRDKNNFDPRLGLAWHPLEKLVIRGGFGFYRVDVKFPTARDQYDEYVATANQQPAPGDPTPIYRISAGTKPPAFNVASNGSVPFVGTNYGGRGVSWWDPNLRNPYVMNWNMSVQRDLGKDYLAEISYQGSGSVGLIERWEANTFPVDYAANDPALRDRVFAASQNYRPFPQFGNIPLRSNFGHSTFHSGTVKLEKRMSRGLFFNTFYTFSKTINSADTDNGGGGVAPLQNRALEKGRAGYDRNHRFIGTVNYALPFGKGKKYSSSNGLVNAIIGGIEISWIQTIESGNPLNFSFANSPGLYYPTYAGARRPNLVGTPDYDFSQWNNGGPDRFTQNNRPAVINMDAFAYPGSFTVGNAGRNILTGPRLVWAQASVQKNFTFKERYRAQIRWDMQNALKTYNFTGPTTTVDFNNRQTFGKLLDDPRTASLGGQPLMNITLAVFF